jgi:hypothetical protein
MRRPLFPRKQTWIDPARAGKLGEFQRFSPGGLFGLNSDFLRVNQDHRSRADRLQRFDHPPSQGREWTHSLMVIGTSGQNQVSTLATANACFNPADQLEQLRPKSADSEDPELPKSGQTGAAAIEAHPASS